MAVFASTEHAEEALRAVRECDAEVHDAVVVVRTPAGHLDLHQTEELGTGEGAIAGGAAGLIAGLLLGIPVGGALLGIVTGGGWGLRDTGIPDSELRRLGEDLEPGQAVLCVLVDEKGLPELREAVGRYGEVLVATEP
jgi:uncharacterized membrane protein